MSIGFSNYLKKELLDSTSCSPKDKDCSDAEFNIHKILKEIPERKEFFKKIFQVLSSDEHNLIYLEGPSGTGKTYLTRTICTLLENSVLTYYYDCSQVTNLDDIILSLFNYLKKVTIKNADYINSFRISSSFSIDERLVNRLKKLDKPLLIVINGTENILDSEEESTKIDLLNFLGFVSSIPAIKVIIEGENFPISESRKKVYSIIINGLTKEESHELIKNTEITDSEEIIEKIFNVTKGYPDNIFLFSTFVKQLEVAPARLLENISLSGMSFDRYMMEQLYLSVPDEYKELMHFFTLTRHSFSAETLKKLYFIDDVDEKIAYLASRMVLSESNGDYHIKQKLKNFLIDKVSKEEKIRIHTWLHDIYSGQISEKLEERILPVSRKILYSEQYYHYKNLAKYGETEEYKVNITQENADYTTGEDIKIDMSAAEKALLDDESVQMESVDTPEMFPEEEIIKEPQELSFEQKELNFKTKLNAEQDKIRYNLDLFELANHYKEHFRHDDALTSYYSILNSDSEDIPESILSEILEYIGEIYDYRGDFNASVKYYLRAMKEAEKSENNAQKAKLYFKLGLTYDDAGDFDNALKFYRKNVETSQDPTLNSFLAAAYSNKAAIYRERKDPVNSIELYKKSLEADELTNNYEGQFDVLSRLGDIYFETSNYPEAGKCFYKELNIAKKINDPYKIAMSYIDMGDIFFFEKNYEKAVKAFIMAKKSIDTTISTDSKEKIDRRFTQVIKEIGKNKYHEIIDNIKNKHA